MVITAFLHFDALVPTVSTCPVMWERRSAHRLEVSANTFTKHVSEVVNLLIVHDCEFLQI